jgi:hypothetical protein
MKRVILFSAVVVALGCIVLLSGAPALAGCYPDNTNPPCEGNFDYNCTVDGLDAAKFKEDFGRSGIKNPCPSAGPAMVPKTGQATSYATGDDGDLEKGVTWPNPRFTDNGDGTVTDNLTGLIWLKNANCFGIKTWDNALSDCNGLNTGECGLTDGSQAGAWRLPNLFELESLRDMQYYGPVLSNAAGAGQWQEDDPFINVQSDGYWSSTTLANYTGVAWLVHMDVGSVVGDYKHDPYYVWPVRGGH